MGRRGGGRQLLERWVNGMRLEWDRLWWWLAVVAVVSIVGHEIARSSTFLAVATAEFEGFDDTDDAEEDGQVPLIVPPPVQQKPGFQNDRGPPAPAPVEESSQESGVGEGIASEPKSRTDFWDEDEFEGLPAETYEEQIVSPGKPTGNRGISIPQGRTLGPAKPQSYYIEAFSIAFLLAYGVVYFIGRKENEHIALAWATQFACKDSILDKNFSLLGTGDNSDSPLLLKEGQNTFKFYASGRRYCESLLASMDLQCRHDLIARLWYLIVPRRDEMTIEVFMNEDSMDPLVFALARKKNAKTMHKESKDLQQFATILGSPSQKKWLAEELVAISESRELATDLLTDTLLDQVFGTKAFEKCAADFVSLHITDQNTEGLHKKMIRFKFNIPPVDRVAEMSRLISLVPYFIDLVGRHKLSPQTRAKADAARAKIAQEAFKESQSVRQGAISRKREERRKAVEEGELKISPEALRKREEKERARQLKKSMPKVKMTRAH